MPPVIVDPDAIREFKDAAALERWYGKHHAAEPELWLRVFKKDSGHPSVTIAEALDIALCWGWIDAIRKSYDSESYLQRYTPRKKTSIWSRINIGHIERLRAAGRMQPAGEVQVTLAQQDGRWERAYGGFRGDDFPADLLAAINASPKARQTFDTLSAQNRFAIAFRTHNLKTPAGRSKKIETLVAMLERGETIYPNGKSK
jgi:uncharacterized protein YdeI (YjbR/CyaY-like superfamily)